MTAAEIISAGTSQVRNNAAMMAEYKRQFLEQFGYEPECPTCGSTADWNKFRAFAHGNYNPQNFYEMADKTFRLRDQHKIYTYFTEEDKNGVRRPVRTFGNLMSEDFAEKYLTLGDEETLAERRKEFKVLPAKFSVQSEAEAEAEGEVERVDLSAMKVAELHDLATTRGYPEEDWKSLKKDELVIYMEARETEAEAEGVNENK